MGRTKASERQQFQYFTTLSQDHGNQLYLSNVRWVFPTLVSAAWNRSSRAIHSRVLKSLLFSVIRVHFAMICEINEYQTGKSSIIDGTVLWYATNWSSSCSSKQCFPVHCNYCKYALLVHCVMFKARDTYVMDNVSRYPKH